MDSDRSSAGRGGSSTASKPPWAVKRRFDVGVGREPRTFLTTSATTDMSSTYSSSSRSAHQRFSDSAWIAATTSRSRSASPRASSTRSWTSSRGIASLTPSLHTTTATSPSSPGGAKSASLTSQTSGAAETPTRLPRASPRLRAIASPGPPSSAQTRPSRTKPPAASTAARPDSASWGRLRQLLRSVLRDTGESPTATATTVPSASTHAAASVVPDLAPYFAWTSSAMAPASSRATTVWKTRFRAAGSSVERSETPAAAFRSSATTRCAASREKCSPCVPWPSKTARRCWPGTPSTSVLTTHASWFTLGWPSLRPPQHVPAHAGAAPRSSQTSFVAREPQEMAAPSASSAGSSSSEISSTASFGSSSSL